MDKGRIEGIALDLDGGIFFKTLMKVQCFFKKQKDYLHNCFV